MTPDDPRHGTYAGAQTHARTRTPLCEPCADARRRYQRRRGKLHQLGRPPRTTLGHLAWNKLDTLISHGLSHSELEHATGLSACVLTRAHHGGPTYRCRVSTRTALEATDPDTALDQRLTHIGTIRRTQALYAIGYSAARQGSEAGITPDTISLLVSGAAVFSSFTTRRKIAAAYERLHMRPILRRDKITARIVNRAAREGWVPPLAWDNVDDPAEKPHRITTRNNTPSHDDIDPAVVERVLGGEKLRTTNAEKAEICRRYYALHGNTYGLAERFGWKVERYFKTSDQDTAA